VFDDVLAALFAALHECGEQERVFDNALAARLPALHKCGKQERAQAPLFGLSLRCFGLLPALGGGCHDVPP
jgi:hypothetical protein